MSKIINAHLRSPISRRISIVIVLCAPRIARRRVVRPNTRLDRTDDVLPFRRGCKRDASACRRRVVIPAMVGTSFNAVQRGISRGQTRLAPTKNYFPDAAKHLTKLRTSTSDDAHALPLTWRTEFSAPMRGMPDDACSAALPLRWGPKHPPRRSFVRSFVNVNVNSRISSSSLSSPTSHHVHNQKQKRMPTPTPTTSTTAFLTSGHRKIAAPRLPCS